VRLGLHITFREKRLRYTHSPAVDILHRSRSVLSPALDRPFETYSFDGNGAER